MSAVRGFAILLYQSYNAQTQKRAAYLRSRGAATIKKAIFTRKNVFWTNKTSKKQGFMSALKGSEISQFISNDIQTHKIVVYLDAQGVATIKR